MEKRLAGKKSGDFVANGFEQVELTEPKKALEDAGGYDTRLCRLQVGRFKVRIMMRRRTSFRR